MSDEPATVVLERGTSESGAQWELRHSEALLGDGLELRLDGAEPQVACGFDIPGTTHLGFAGGLKPGQGDYFLFGLTSARVVSVVAESASRQDEVQTSALPLEAKRSALRFFVLVREPVDDVDALVALDADRGVVQRVDFPRP